MGKANYVIVGDALDEHVINVSDHLEAESIAVFDLATLACSNYLLDDDVLKAEFPHSVEIEIGSGVRGWLRRLAPPRWQDGIVLGSRGAASKASWATLLASVIRNIDIEWLTDIDDLNRAENKLAQYKAARVLGIPAPRTVVTSDSLRLAAYFEDRAVVKPLGPGHFFDSAGQGNVVFSAAISVQDSCLTALAGAPFIVQEAITASVHLRIVTVLDRVWACVLPAKGLPLDWRREPIAHRSFRSTSVDIEVELWALSIARHLRVGYSSQDWIIDEEGNCWFIDLNPSGQWLFLPQETSEDVSQCIADWLRGGGDSGRRRQS